MCSVLLVGAGFSQWWPPAINLGIPGVDDINPQACRSQGLHTVMAWQSFLGGDWEIFTRFYHNSAWTDTVRLTRNSIDDCYPSVAYDAGRNCFWCAWQKDTAGFWSIYVARGDSLNRWFTPVKISTAADNEHPSIYVIGTQVWVVWQNNTAALINLLSSYYNGTSWSAPAAVTNDSIFDNLLPRVGIHNNHPFVVWQRNQDIYRSEYTGTTWPTPLTVTTDPAVDSLPELTNPSFIGSAGTMIFWQSDRNGDWDIYRTGADTFTVNLRATLNGAADVEPSPLFAVGITQRGLPPFAFSTNRNGSYDIYSSDSVYVDTNDATDALPVMTGGDWYIWTLWQSDRNGDWDIYGSRMSVGGVEEGSANRNPGSLRVQPNPFQNRTTIYFSKEHSAPLRGSGASFQDFQTKGIELNIYDVTGRLVKIFSFPSALSPNPSVLIWDGTDRFGRAVSAGVYFVCLKTSGGVIRQKIIDLR
jgi:hypothetical protein